MEDTKVLTLIKPVEFGGTTYTELTLCEPTAGDLEKASNATNSMGMVITLVSLVAKVPRKVAEKLCQRDLQAAGDFFDRFSKPSPATDENSSQT